MIINLKNNRDTSIYHLRKEGSQFGPILVRISCILIFALSHDLCIDVVLPAAQILIDCYVVDQKISFSVRVCQILYKNTYSESELKLIISIPHR